ncbi:MAG: DNA translocase FtsK 4TM domain-containing protein [Kiritimatiellae bacterium]|nr:DNA translocase FtsK 4TM domain-containing protein [Kiritimatiellia bacterium]
MAEASSSTTEQNYGRRILAWALFPLALFPLAALLTYDWRSIPALNTPPAPSTNWIGSLGDRFAYYGYEIFGLAVWVVPAVCIVLGVGVLAGRRVRRWSRGLWLALFLISVSCLMQAIGKHTVSVASEIAGLNVQNAGGAVGYLLMTKLLSPLISDFGSAVLMAALMAVSLAGAIGVGEIVRFIAGVCRWALARPGDGGRESDGEDNDEEEKLRERQYRAAMEAKAAAKEEARREKERIKAEKAAAKAAKKAARGRAEEQPAGLPAQNAAVQTGAERSDADDKGPYILPPMSLLNPLKKTAADHSDVDEMTVKLIDTLKLFGVDAELDRTVQGPVVTKYALKLAPGIRYSSVTNISDNLMGALHAKSLRIEAPIPGEECVGIEVPNRAPAGISFREIIESAAWRNFKGELPLLFGKDAAGRELVADLASMPHMLVAGATGQGKSVCLNAIINGLLMTKTPEQLKLIMVDPKSVEFNSYASLPHLIVPVITDNKKVVFSLHWAVMEMEKRLKLFARARVRNIYDYNHRPQFTQTDMFGDDAAVGSDMPRTVPYIVIIIDEVADLMSSNGKEVTPDIARLTAKARAAGIHLILATQRPDAKVITGTIKANIPGRVAFKTATAIDSRTILDDTGAENLIGKGDMLFKGKDGSLIRAQGAWISDPEIAGIIRFIEQHSSVQFDPKFAKKLGTIKDEEIDIFAEPEEDEAAAKAAAANQREMVKSEENAADFKKAVECIINTNRASTSHFQRKLGWGYNHSAKIMDMLEEAGIIGPQSGAGPRPIIMDQQQLLDIFNGGGDPGAATAELAYNNPQTENES